MILIRTGAASQIQYRDRHYANVSVLIQPFDPVGNTSFISYGTAIGNNGRRTSDPLLTSNLVVVDTVTSGFVGSSRTSLEYSVANSRLAFVEMANNSSMNIGTGDCTIEFFMYLRSFHPNASATMATRASSANTGLLISRAFYWKDSSSSGQFHSHIYRSNVYFTMFVSSGNQPVLDANLVTNGCTTNSWIHVAVTKTYVSGTTSRYRMFFNGKMVANTTGGYNTAIDGQSNYILWIGGHPGFFQPEAPGNGYTTIPPRDYYGGSIDGYLDDIRITRNFSRYQSDFDLNDIIPFANTA